MSDRARLRAYFGRAPERHLYELGDLDDFFWPHTRWYGLEHGDDLRAVVLLYGAGARPVAIAIGDRAELAELLDGIREQLPARLYAAPQPARAQVRTSPLVGPSASQYAAPAWTRNGGVMLAVSGKTARAATAAWRRCRAAAR